MLERPFGSHNLVVSMSAVELDLPSHDGTQWPTARHAIHGFGKVEFGLHLPQLFVLVWREQLSRISDCDPADWDGDGRSPR